MSRRLIHRARYPEAPVAEQVSNANSQFPQNPPAAPSPMPFYDPSLQPQTTQNSWSQPPYSDPNAYQPNHPAYPVPNAYQHNQVPQQPVADAAAYWSGSQMLPVSSQAPWNESWNYKPETVPDSANFASYQQPVVPPATEQWQQPAQYSQNTNLNYPPQQQPSAGFDQSYQTGYEYPTTNNNSNVIPPNSTPPWENGGMETTQPEQPPWAYSQYSETAQAQGLENTEPKPWPQEPNNYVASSDYNVPDGTSANYLYANAETVSASSENTSHNPSPSVEQLEGDLHLRNFEPVPEKTSDGKEKSEFDYASSTLAAFFHSDQEVVSTQPETVSIDPGVELSSQSDVSSAPEVISNQIDVPGVVSDNDRLTNNYTDDNKLVNNETGASVSTEVYGAISNQLEGCSLVDNHCDVVGLGGSQLDTPGEVQEQFNGIVEHEVNFVQEERMLDMSLEENQCSSSISSSGFVEEPINQEVPEPHRNESSITQSQPVQEYEEIVAEDPPNQQIPTGSGQTSRSTSSERERIVIRPREESPFKPPRPGSSKGIVVQQEISPQPQETKPTEGKDANLVVQEVNLETFPDNLERPSDYEELRKQSPLYTSRKQHLRSEVNSSPSSLLCENLNIPCGLILAPAAPPLSSSAKSDRSESSTDSKNATGGPVVFKTNESSLSGSSCDIREEDTYRKPKDQHLSRKETTSNTLPSRTREPPRTYDNPPLKPTNDTPSIEKNDKDLHQPVYLKDSRLNGNSRQPQPPLRQAVSNTEIPESKIPPSRNPNRDPKYHSDEMIDSHQQDSRRFDDQKYPGFDDRQYYSDRERSRPSSRTSSRERTEEIPYRSGDTRRYPHQEDTRRYPHEDTRRYPQEDTRRYPQDDTRRYPQEDTKRYPQEDTRRYPPQDQGRPSSRLSNESDTRRGDRQYYQQPYGYPAQNAYPRNSADYYNRQAAPNQRGYEREYDPYQQNPYYPSYYDPRYAYSNYNYGFYDEFYRNDPRYKQYQEECRQYYAKYGRHADYERSSVHSGRSSANELSKDVSRSDHYPEPDIDSNESEFSGYNLEQNYSYDGVQNEISNTDAASTPSSRLTPVKFSYPHPIARFSPGGMLITAIPNQLNTSAATTIRIHNLQVIREDEDSFKELKNYQGPLVRGSTHKNDVIEFCTQKIKTIQSAEDVVDRDSYTLLWELMVLLLRQNGSVAGSDIAELLLKDHEVLRPPSLALKQIVEVPQGEHSPADINDSQSHGGDTSSPDEGIVVLHDKTILNNSGTVDVDKITRKFREFLLFGHKKDALEWAMKHGLWGHALFLASKMDLRTYANVMTRFANSLALNDPLQTLYQLMSGRQPLAVTNVADKKWGDWRPHLAMILSNPSSLPDVDSKSITTLGDTLANKGCLCAAHFCYIMAQVEFGTYEQTSSKFVLLTANHSLPFEEFATNEAVQVTEIYEYAQSLANKKYQLVHLQFYKFLYAMRLVEHGFLEEALHYCEIIAGKIQDHSICFQLDFISQVFNLATLLKYHDPHFLRGQGEFEDQDDPEWLKNLAHLIEHFNDVPVSEPPQPYIEQQQQQPAETIQTQNVNNQQYATQSNENLAYNNVPNQATQNEVNNSYNQMNYYQQSGWIQPSSLQNSTFSPSNSSHDNTGYYPDSTLTNQSSFHRQNSLPSHEENETTDVPSSPVTQTPPFDYYSGGTQQAHETKSIYDTSNNYNNNINSISERERRDSAMSSGSRYSAGSTSVANKSSAKESKPEAKKDKHTSQAGKTWLGGIFSRLLPKAPNQMILPDDKNPTIYWDDVNNCWVNKDSNDEDETSAPLAPPTDTELMGSQSSNAATFHSPMPPQSTYGASVPPANTALPPADKFRRAKTRGMRQNYVDVLSTSGATKKNNIIPEALFPTPYESANSPQMFMPTTTSNTVGENSASDFEQNHASYNSPQLEKEEPVENQATPLMFDPAAFDARRSNATNQRPGLGQAGRRTYPT